MKLKQLLEHYSDYLGDEGVLTADGFDEAIIGLDRHSLRVVYDSNKMVQILMENDGMSEEEAIEFLEYNVYNAWIGEKTPIYLI